MPRFVTFRARALSSPYGAQTWARARARARVRAQTWARAGAWARVRARAWARVNER